MTTSKSAGWVMPDPDRCQCEWLGGSFMTLGPRQMVRCEKPPTVIVSETSGEPPHGSMSLCDEHLVAVRATGHEIVVWRKE